MGRLHLYPDSTSRLISDFLFNKHHPSDTRPLLPAALLYYYIVFVTGREGLPRRKQGEGGRYRDDLGVAVQGPQDWQGGREDPVG